MYGTCRNNPYESGCLRSFHNHKMKKGGGSAEEDVLTTKYKLRMCNSDDDKTFTIGGMDDVASTTNGGLCRIEEYSDNFELRLHTQNWEAAIFEVWILQIVLSELLNVPTTVETGTPFVQGLNFYDPLSRFNINGKSYYRIKLKQGGSPLFFHDNGNFWK